MKVRRVNNRMVVECQHCKGTTRCQHSVPFDRDVEEAVDPKRGVWGMMTEHVLRCPKCGDGFAVAEIRLSDDPAFDLNRLYAPICAVCEGRGFVVV